MNNQKLTLMAENIIANFSAYSQEEQIEQTSQHIQQFWTPAMRQDLQQELDNNQDNSQLLRKVIELI